MAYNDDQNDFPLPGDGNEPEKRTSAQHLPKYFRTTTNKKFLQSTLDQLIQPGVPEKLNGYFGRRNSKSYKAGDTYISDVSSTREAYQFEPASVIKDDLDNINFYKDYNDYVNQLTSFNAVTNDHSRLNQQEYYAWNPHIDWDKFSNFREYYWLPNGPQTVSIAGQSIDVESTYTVSLANNLDNNAYLFSPDGKTQNPSLKLYRGITYTFKISTPGLPFTFRTKRTLDDSFLLETGVSAQNVEDGEITLKLTTETPDEIYYVADNDINVAGLIKVANIEEASAIDVETEILGKQYYTTQSGLSLSNGMKINFIGEVTPEKYASKEYYVEGVGNKIVLIAEDELNVSSEFTSDFSVEFDGQEFDRLPFDEATGYPAAKDYLVINRSSKDGNLWSRYNRWFHKSVIETAAKENGLIANIDQSQRAKRPIIEFSAGLKLYNFGTKIKLDVDLVDTYTTDVFSTIEGSNGYNIDGVDVTDGMRILFLADPDPFVNGKIYKVKFINFADGSGRVNQRQITLLEEADTTPVENEVTLVKQGFNNLGIMYFYDGTEWKQCQRKLSVNQAPLFDIFDENGNSYSDKSVYDATTFVGNKVFSYKQGTGLNDTELGFPLAYRSIDNVGDITFNFDLLNGSFDYQVDNDLLTKKTDIGFIRQYEEIDVYKSLNGWQKGSTLQVQNVIRQYVYDNTRIGLEIDVYDNSNNIEDLWIRVYKNNKLLFENIDYTVSNSPTGNKVVNFTENLITNDNIIIKTRSKTPKNENGFYEIASNLERNPGNNNLTEFTLGEVSDHVSSIVEEIEDFTGVFPGTSNLRDIGNLSAYGKRFVKHSSPLNLSLYSLLEKDSNALLSLRYARKEYGKFKRLFLQKANDLGFEGPVKEHVDRIMKALNRDKISTMPFYFSDMVPTGASKTNNYEITDEQQQFFALTEFFDLNSPSRKAVQVYLNGEQLLHNKHYTFNENGFVVLNANQQTGDTLTIYEYESTNGSYVPPTPTKLGLYPLYEPAKYLDNTFREPINVIQGHDGSIFVAYDDFRDDLILELEKRIFNNVKSKYDPNLFDIHSYVGGQSRETGFTYKEIDKPMLADFVEWLLLVDEDYTDHSFFSRVDTFTFNYSEATDPNGNEIPGYWRRVYNLAYDTDRPHTHPWEMLGFTIKPNWWEEQYGPAPYTKDNLVMWQDIEAGIIRIPGQKFRVNPKYKRPGLTRHLPVDSSGNLLSPNDSGYITNFNASTIVGTFVYGDGAPVESAWRKSSEYPFALLTSFMLNQPSKFFATGFDRYRQKRNITGQLIYSETNNHLRLNDIIFPNTTEDEAQIYTSGLINYVTGYMASSVTSSYAKYKNNLKSLTNQIGFKIGGFTEKNKFKLILDSRSPTNQGNVFIPEENYKIFLNTSSPVKTLSYSGVIIERRSNGYIVRGYDNTNPAFTVYNAIALDNDPTINVGGISESYLTWESSKQYVAGNNVEYNGSYYRVTKDFVSGSDFSTESLSKLPRLPLIGGREAVFRRKFFKNVPTQVPYGTLYRNIQEVVDFLLGYEQYLEDQGFVFDYFNTDDEVVTNWKTSAKEFLFWTTQNWASGSVITLSPAAFELQLNSEYSIVDNIFDTFYGYTLLNQEGKKLNEEFSTLGRQNSNQFVLRAKNTEDGIFAVKLPLVQKEHVVLLDNTTVFNDTIYDPEPGYRQERLKVLGYRSTDWDGSINVPGFIYDDAKVTEWEAWKDYSIGDTVRYKEFYYTADQKIPGEETFDNNKWVILKEKPSPELIPNFEYRTNQFADFYDLDSDNFDSEQQRLAQHLIGYQKRKYLENIINDDVSQYKFFQGMIQDKGTKNALTKLFDVLGGANKDSLEFYEEWAIRSGQYGASSGYEEVEFKLDESQFRLTPQPIELVDRIEGDETDLIYRIRPFEVYSKPPGYNNNVFPAKYVNEGYTKDSGYINPEDVQHIVQNYDGILNLNFTDVAQNDYVWVGNEGLSWNVYKHLADESIIEKVERIPGTNDFNLVLTTTPSYFKIGEIIGVFDLIDANIPPDDSSYSAILASPQAVGKFYKITNVLLNKITVQGGEEPVDEIEKTIGKISRFVSVRTDNLKTLNKLAETIATNKSLFWVDDGFENKWSVLEARDSYVTLDEVSTTSTASDIEYATSIAVNKSNTVIAIGAPGEDDGKVYIYRRGANNQNWRYSQVLEADVDLALNQRFGESIDMSADGKFLLVGSPNASNVRSNFKNAYDPNTDYITNDIVEYQNSLWIALEDISAAEASITFTSFDSVEQIVHVLGTSQQTSDTHHQLIIGNAPIAGAQTDHMLIRAPKDQYEGTKSGDRVKLKWNNYSAAFAEQDNYNDVFNNPFGGYYNAISSSGGNFINGERTIAEKVDTVLYVDTYTSQPVPGDRVETTTAFGTVVYVYEDTGQLVIYLNNVNGTFRETDTLFLANGEYVGAFERTLPEAGLSSDHDNYLGGYWKFDIGSTVTTSDVSNRMFDEGKGLVFVDVVTEAVPASSDRYFYNILDYRTNTFSSENTLASYIRTLSFEGLPGPGGVIGDFLSDKFVIRAPKALTDVLSPGDSFDFYLPVTTRFSTNTQPNDPTQTGLSFSDLNRELFVNDLWDGYIFFEYTKFDGNGDPFEPRIGDIVEDVTTGATGEVVFYQRDGLNVTVFVKNVVGSWSQGDDYGDNAEIKFQGTPGDPDPIYQVERVMGQIQYRSLGLPNEGIGKLIVVDNGTNISVPTNAILTGAEYWFYNEDTVDGIARPANIPSVDNNDWNLTYKIPVIEGSDQSGYVNEGMYSIYELKGSTSYALQSAYTVPTSSNAHRLGNNVRIAQNNNLYRIFVHAGGPNADLSAPGKIYFVKKGIDSYGDTYDFDYAKDKNFKGEFSPTLKYYTNDIVYYAGFTYESKTNLDPGAFNSNDWRLVTDAFDYLGYIPNKTNLLPYFDSTDGSTLDSTVVENFGNVYDVSANGEVLAVVIKSTSDPNKVLIYRINREKFQLYQQIEAPNNSIEFGSDIALSKDGEILAVGAPYDDGRLTDQGKVFVYTLQNEQFELSQELNSRNGEKVELFGSQLNFTDTALTVTARNGDGVLGTSFEDGFTLDNGFTTFGITIEDAGVVYIYDKVGTTLVYGQTLDYIDDKDDDRTQKQFGKHLYANGNHIYVGMPNLSTRTDTVGTFIDFNQLPEVGVWNIIRKPVDTVNVEKIKKMFLYDTKENKLLAYLDYIDPIQGKIAGPAEQELRFKTYFDPAFYTNGGETLNVDQSKAWEAEHVGQLWWDLTNAKFLNPYQGNIIFGANNWNKLFDGNTIDVYEWVESQYTPARWNELADTDEGFAKGISGQTKYDDTVYSSKRVYDNVARTFKTRYYFWVGNKKVVPNVEGRFLSASEVAKLIADPAGLGYKFVSLLSPNRFVIHNCKSLVKDKDVALSVQYWTIENQQINIHNQYQIITEGLESSKPNPDIERKWFDSLIGKDDRGRSVPSLEVGVKERYGILNNPRQSWFVNNTEAFKQVVERVNGVLKQNLIIDDKDITPLFAKDPEPVVTSNKYDTTVDILADLEFVGVAKAQQAKLTPVIKDGVITRVVITDPGRGYKVVPTIKFIGTGSGAEIKLTLNSVGAVIDAEVVSGGKNYNNDLVLDVRRFTVLVKNDETIQGKWALYERNSLTREWNRTISQSYDTTLLWNYIDWYAEGYNEFTEINNLIDESYQLLGLNDEVGDIVKISSIGSGGWLLLEKIDDLPNVDYTQNYKTVGRQNGTIQFSKRLYDTTQSLVGYDSISYDTKFFDSQPVTEARIVLNTIKNNLLIDELAIEYNKLFFASLRYVFSEQGYVDWAFKTSFIKAKHNVGDLEQKVTFQNDNLASYEDYLNEVKPYKSKLREYLSDYDVLDNSNSVVTDFDLAPTYDFAADTIKPQNIKVKDNTLIGVDADVNTYPNKNWYDNFTYKVEKINIGYAGLKYDFPPKIEISGGGGTGAVAVAKLGKDGEITDVIMTNNGSGYISQPTVTVNGSLQDGGKHAVLSAKLGLGLVRNMHTVVKFDRHTGQLRILDLNESESFVGTGSKYVYDLKYPMDLRFSTIEVTVSNNLSLRSEYTFENILDTSKGYDRYFGRITFTTPPTNASAIVVNYKKPIQYLEVQDRINLFYNPNSGQLANELSQLMDGIDYGGVEVKAFEFGGASGWDSQPWYTDKFDTYDGTYEDEVFILDGSTISLDLAKPLENGVVYNVYRNGVRLDDPNFGTGNPVTNTNAVMQSITGDGVTQVLELQDNNVPTSADDKIILRKASSDGSFLPDPEAYDVSYEGGNLAYSTATGVNAQDIIVDGDGFVTPTTSKGPEELVPGQLLDTLDITVYERPTEGSSNITTRNYIGDGSTKTYNIDLYPFTNESVFVKVDSDILDSSNYTINNSEQSITFNTAPAANTRINITTFSITGSEILDIDSFVSDGSTNNFLTNVQYSTNVNFIVTTNGIEIPSIILESTSQDGTPGNILISLSEPAQAGDIVNYALFKGENPTDVNFSQVNIETIIADGSTVGYPLTKAPFYQQPHAYNTIVKAGNTILHAGYSQTFTVSNIREYQLNLGQFGAGDLGNQNLELYLNGEKLEYIQQWTFVGAGTYDPTLPDDEQNVNTVILADGIGSVGDELKVYVISDGEYRFGYYETDADSTNAWNPTPGVIYFDNVYPEGTEIDVYTFSNHDAQKINRSTYDVIERTVLTTGTDQYYFARQLRNGLIKLNKEAYDSQYVWIMVNNVLLTPNVDYSVLQNKKYVKLVTEVATDDKIEIIHFTAPPVTNKFGWRQFKDMLNRNHYKRLDNTKKYTLAEDLNYYDNEIVLVSSEGILAPPENSKTPGVIFIDGERIEYFKKTGNKLTQIRRSTLGTGIKDSYPAGTEFYEQSIDQNMPYKDNTITTIFTADGTSNLYELDFDTDNSNTVGVQTKEDLFEVFVAGRRLRKKSLRSFQLKGSIRDQYAVDGEVDAQDSPEGDVTLPPEFEVSGNTLTLTETPQENVKVIVIRKQGLLWSDPGTPLSESESDISRFLRATTVDLPR